MSEAMAWYEGLAAGWAAVLWVFGCVLVAAVYMGADEVLARVARRRARRKLEVRDIELDELRAWASSAGVPLRTKLDARDREILYGVPGGSKPEGIMFEKDGEEAP